MTDKPLNPPETPLCPEYAAMMYKADHIPLWRQKTRYLKLLDKAEAHRATCPICQARKAEFDELAKNAEYPEVKDET